MSKTAIGVGAGDLDLLEILLRGPDVWNQWREENPTQAVNLIDADLSRADLSRTDLRDADLSNANLSSAYLIDADLSRAYLSRANLSRSNLSGANLSSADLLYVSLSRANLSNANLSNANLIDANLIDANLNRADLSGANLIDADLSGANYSGANLSGADLSGANLNRADLSGANLSDADLSGANLSGAIIPNETQFDIRVFDKNISPNNLEQLKAAIDKYTIAAGYKEIAIISEKYGSWIKRIRNRIARLISQEVQEEAIKTGQEFYRTGKASALNHLEKSGIESTKQIAEATAEILKAVENLDDVVLLLGKLIIMKYTNVDGRSKTYVKTISSDLQLKLESTPELLDSPQAIINFLKSQEELPPAIEKQKTLPRSVRLFWEAQNINDLTASTQR